MNLTQAMMKVARQNFDSDADAFAAIPRAARATRDAFQTQAMLFAPRQKALAELRGTIAACDRYLDATLQA